MLTIDQLCYSSKLRRVNANEKFAFTILTLFICVASRNVWIAGIVLLVNTILTVGGGRIPFGRYLKLMLLPFAFLIMSTAAIVINVSKVPFDAYAIPVGDYYITSSVAAVFMAIQLSLTALSAVSCLYFLTLNTPMTDILRVLRKCHCPNILIELMLLIYRFIFILLSTAKGIRVSQKSRLGYQDYKTSLRSFSSLCATVFIRAMKRANALYDAMESRGYDGTLRVLEEEYEGRIVEIILIVLFEALLIGIWILKVQV